MAYATAQDVEIAAGGSQKVRELTDVESTGVANAAALADAIRAADAWINSYAQRRHAVPFQPVPEIIRRVSAREAVYQLLLLRGMVTEERRQQHEDDRLWLVDLARGAVSPGTEPSPAKSSAVVPRVSQRSSSEAISRESLKGMW